LVFERIGSRPGKISHLQLLQLFSLNKTHKFFNFFCEK
jgi:hypothetical protein